jgi:HEAT repeat protein
VGLQEAIQRIVPGFNTIFFFDQSQPESERIALVRVFPRTAVTPQPSVLYLGTGAITRSGDNGETEEQALKILSGSAEIEAKEKAIEILVNAKSDEGIKELMKSISNPAPEIRVAAIEGLAALNAKEALPGVLKSLKDQHPAVRQSAATAVALLGTAQNIKDLKPLTSDKDAGVSAAAETAIRKLLTAVKK